jgi:hypothetical protein
MNHEHCIEIANDWKDLLKDGPCESDPPAGHKLLLTYISPKVCDKIAASTHSALIKNAPARIALACLMTTLMEPVILRAVQLSGDKQTTSQQSTLYALQSLGYEPVVESLVGGLGYLPAGQEAQSKAAYAERKKKDKKKPDQPAPAKQDKAE